MRLFVLVILFPSLSYSLVLVFLDGYGFLKLSISDSLYWKCACLYYIRRVVQYAEFTLCVD